MIKYLFLDTETTGLLFDSQGSPKKVYLLEVAGMLVDEKLFVLNDFQFTLSIDPAIMDTMDEVAKKMHQDNGLLERCFGSSTTIKEVDSALEQIIKPYIDDGDTIILAGSTISFDQEVVRRFLPQLYQRLHFRIFDISSVRSFIRLVYPEVVESVITRKKMKHTAKSDIEETFSELLTYLSLLKGEQPL